MDDNTIPYRGHKIVLAVDDDPIDPREDGHSFGTMICFHRRYSLGDKHEYSDPDDMFMALAGALPNRKHHHPVSELLGDGSKYKIVWEPLYLYDHSGITMSTKPFSCPWDSGQVGIIYATYDKVRENYQLGPDDQITAEIIEQAEELLKAEVATYDEYIRGEVFYYSTYAPLKGVDDPECGLTEEDDGFWNEEAVDSCGNCFGRDYTIQYAKECLDGILD